MNRNFSTNDDCAINGEIDETETIEDKLKFNKEIILNVSLPSYRGPDANVFENNSEISNKITSYNLHTKDSEIKRNFSTSLFSNKTISPQTNRFAHYSPNVALLKESEEFNKFQLGSPRRSKHLQTDSKAGIKTRLSRYSMSQYKINKKISFDDQDVAMELDLICKSLKEKESECKELLSTYKKFKVKRNELQKSISNQKESYDIKRKINYNLKSLICSKIKNE